MLKALLFLQLLYVVNQVHFPWGTGIPGVAPINILFVLSLLLMRGKPDPVPTPGLIQKPLINFFWVLGFAFLWAQVREFGNFMDDATYFKNAIFFMAFYFMYRNCRQDEKTTRWLIIWILVIAAVAGLEAIREGFDYGFGKYNPMRRASGPFGTDWRHANRAGVFYGMFTPMFMAMLLFLKNSKFWRMAAIGGVILMAGGALFTYSRQAYFLVILAITVLLVRRSLVIAFVAGVIAIFAIGYLPDSVFQRVDETHEASKSGTTEEEVDASTASRWEIWAGAMKMLANNPIGVGLNHFKKNIGAYDPKHKGFDAHNFYVLTLAECGPQGLIVFLMLMAALFRAASELRKRAPPDDSELVALSQGFAVTTMCMALGGIYGSPTLEGSVMVPYWALLGLLERLTYLRTHRGDGPAVIVREATLAERFPLAAHILPGRGPTRQDS